MLCTICELIRAAHNLILTLLFLKDENRKLHYFVCIKQVAQYPPVYVYRLHVKFQGVLTTTSEVTIDIIR